MKKRRASLLSLLVAILGWWPILAPAQTRDLAVGPDPREIPVPPIQTPLGTMPGVNYAHHAHALTAEDWTVLLDFADQQLGKKKVERRFDQFPPDQVPATPAPDAAK